MRVKDLNMPWDKTGMVYESSKVILFVKGYYRIR